MSKRRQRRRGLGSAPEAHANRVTEIHADIEKGLQEAEHWVRSPKLAQTPNACHNFFDGVQALKERLGRAQSHLDSVAGTPAATTQAFKTQKRLASKVGSLATKFRRKCMRGPQRRQTA
jgi:hypothetical protein